MRFQLEFLLLWPYNLLFFTLFTITSKKEKAIEATQSYLCISFYFQVKCIILSLKFFLHQFHIT